jgi:hypothetical protein
LRQVSGRSRSGRPRHRYGGPRHRGRLRATVRPPWGFGRGTGHQGRTRFVIRDGPAPACAMQRAVGI